MGLKLKSTGGTGSVQLNCPDNHNLNTSFTLPTTNVTGGEFVLADGSGNVNIDSGTLYVDAVNDRVGIGTASPGALLTLAASVPELRLVDSDNSLYGTITAPGGDIYIDADKGNGAGGSIIRFAVDDSEKARIDSSGRVGIGESNPSAGLHVVTDVNPVLKLDRGSANAANANLYYNGTLTGQISAANADFQVSAVGASTPISFYANGSERFQIGVNGKHYFNADGTAGRIYLNTTNDNRSFGENSAGTGSAATYIGNAQIQVSSDKRIKENIQDTQLDALAAVKQISVKDFTWNDPKDTSHNNRNARGTWTGVIAQELVEILPFVVNAPRNEDDLEIDHDSEEIWTLDQSQLCPVLIKAMQQQQAMIETLEATNASFEARLTALEGGQP